MINFSSLSIEKRKLIENDQKPKKIKQNDYNPIYYEIGDVILVKSESLKRKTNKRAQSYEEIIQCSLSYRDRIEKIHLKTVVKTKKYHNDAVDN